MQLPGPFSSMHRYRVHLPAAFRFESSAAQAEYRLALGLFQAGRDSAARATRATVELVMETRLEKDRVDPEHFAEYQIFRDDVNRAYRVWLTFKPTRNLADAPLLETLLALAPGSDLLTVQTLARMYLDDGQHEDARRVLDANLLYHMDNRSLWELRVRAAATSRRGGKDLSDHGRAFSQASAVSTGPGRRAGAAERSRRGPHGAFAADRGVSPIQVARPGLSLPGPQLLQHEGIS